MYEPITLVGEEGARFIVANGGIAFESTTQVQMEEAFILGITNWMDYLKENGHYDSTTPIYVASVYNKDKEQAHQVVVEVTTGKTEAEGFGQNEKPLIWEDGTTTRYYTVKGGVFPYNVSLKCKSTSRSSVSYLVDAVRFGLETNMDTYLASMDVNIPPSSITTSETRPTKISETFTTWEKDVNINGVVVHWNQIYETSGEILKNFGYYIEKSNS